MKKDLITDLIKIVSKVNLNQNNTTFLDLLTCPTSLQFTRPGKFDKASDVNEGETAWQRNIYNRQNEKDIWMDLELPIGKLTEGNHRNKRIDLIGTKNSSYIISELKYHKIGMGAGQPFDAVLQLLAYSKMIVENQDSLEKFHVHHTNAHNTGFSWIDVATNHVLLLRANNEYWLNINKNTAKNRALKEIILCCKKHGLMIYLYNDTTAINI